MGHPFRLRRADHVIRMLFLVGFNSRMYVFVCAVCQQGTHLFIGSLSGRFVFLTTFVATLALFNIIFGLGTILLLVLSGDGGGGGGIVRTFSLQRKFK